MKGTHVTSEPAPDRPTGPPSGPLSHPPAGGSGSGGRPPDEPPSGGGDGGGGGSPRAGDGGGRPWWRSVPVIASLAGLLVAAVALALVLSRSEEAQAAVMAESVSYRPPNSFTPSTATPAEQAVEPLPTQQRHRYAGSAPELYGGSGDRAVCDVERQIAYLEGDRAKAKAFASALKTSPEDLPAYLRGLTSVQLRLDTLVTNHGYEDGRAVPYQAILQAGTAVMIDEYGVPRVRCVCGNPLDRPQVERPEKVVGKTWPGFRAEEVVIVEPAPTPVPTFTVVDPATGERVERPRPTGTSPSPTGTDTASPTTTGPPTTPDGGTDTPAGTPTGEPPADRPTGEPADSPTGRTEPPPDGGTPPPVTSPEGPTDAPPPNGSPTGEAPGTPPGGSDTAPGDTPAGGTEPGGTGPGSG
ncbi:hypothetical protein BG846_03423 [Streptomyces fradiae ATCC 10745 = DSM 40063]|uniref:DUF6777 domain-containing protein n=1 Tax=Streptomyces fradiae ATCC 10745 = DSM 40063 TaxID=1319510 RepID=A0A1Y2NTU3_STRFR|nr:hypothetical protein BG846_03423 [Streptomyces fradiae ATCC 10745 = DSM 40063]